MEQLPLPNSTLSDTLSAAALHLTDAENATQAISLAVSGPRPVGVETTAGLRPSGLTGEAEALRARLQILNQELMRVMVALGVVHSEASGSTVTRGHRPPDYASNTYSNRIGN